MRTIFDIANFGAIGDGRTLNTTSIEACIDACRRAGGGIIRVHSGIFVTGVFELYSNMTLSIEKGASLLAGPRQEDHIVGAFSLGLIYAQDAHNVFLTGEGILDGNAEVFFNSQRLHSETAPEPLDSWQMQNGLPYGSSNLVHGPLKSGWRPGNMLVFARCRNVRVENLHITGAPYWTIHCADCEDVVIRNLNIANDLRHPNNDGIHITSCRNVEIRNCCISCGDDAIAITGFREAGNEPQIAFGLTGQERACEEISVSDCFLTSRSAAVRIGYGHNPVRKVRLTRLDIMDSNRGIGIFARQGDVEDVVIEHCRIRTRLHHGNWWGRGEPIHVSSVRFPGENANFTIHGITFRNIDAAGENALVLFSEQPGAIQNVELRHVEMTLQRSELFEQWGGNIDLRPAWPEKEILPGGNAPLWAVGVQGLRCINCRWMLEDAAIEQFLPDPVVLGTMVG